MDDRLRGHFGMESWSKSNYGRGGMGGISFGKAGMVRPKPPNDKPLEKAIKKLVERMEV